MAEPRYIAWRDQLPDDATRGRADYVATLPPGMSVAVVDHDLRGALKATEKRIITEIEINREAYRAKSQLSRKTIAFLAMLGGALVDAAGSAIHNLRP